MTKALELTGQRFAWLTVIKRAPNNSHGSAVWLCRCACGKETFAGSSELKRGMRQSCGCKRTSPGSKWGGVGKKRQRLASYRYDIPNANELPEGW